MKSISASERGLQREEKRTNAIDALGYNIRNQLTPRERQQVSQTPTLPLSVVTNICFPRDTGSLRGKRPLQ